MFKQLFSSLSIVGVLLSSTSALSPEYSAHPYSLSNFCNGKPCNWESRHWHSNFDSLPNALDAAQYFWLLGQSSKFTSKGILYSSCKYKFRIQYDFYYSYQPIYIHLFIINMDVIRLLLRRLTLTQLVLIWLFEDSHLSEIPSLVI